MANVDLNFNGVANGDPLDGYSESNVVFSTTDDFVFQDGRIFAQNVAGGDVGNALLTNVTPTTDTYTLKFTARRLADYVNIVATDVSTLGFDFCKTDENNFYRVLVGRPGRVAAVKAVAGTVTIEGTYTIPGLTENTDLAEVQIDVTPAGYTVSYGGTTVITVADTNLNKIGPIYIESGHSSQSATTTTGYHMDSARLEGVSILSDFNISNIDGDNSVEVGQTANIALLDGVQTVPTTDPDSWSVTLGGETLTPVDWNSGAPTVTIPSNISLTTNQTYELVVSYTVGASTYTAALSGITLLPEEILHARINIRTAVQGQTFDAFPATADVHYAIFDGTDPAAMASPVGQGTSGAIVSGGDLLVAAPSTALTAGSEVIVVCSSGLSFGGNIGVLE